MLSATPPLPRTLRPSRTRTALMLLGSVAFVAIGVLMVRDHEPLGYLVGGSFALGVPIFALQFHPRAAYLQLTGQGFTFCSLFRAHTVEWKTVAEFGVIGIGAHRMVGWNFVPGHPRTGHARAISRALSSYEAALPDTYGLRPVELADLMNTLRQRWDDPPAPPFFGVEEVARLIQGQPVREPLPFDPADDASIRRFCEELVRRIEEERGLRARVEWHHYGSGYASFIAAWFYPADGSARRPPFHPGEERHMGLTVLFSRLSCYFALTEDEQSWMPDGSSGSGSLPNFDAVDDLSDSALQAHVVPLTARLEAAGLQRLYRQDLATFLPEACQVPTILASEPLRQFDALFYWED